VSEWNDLWPESNLEGEVVVDEWGLSIWVPPLHLIKHVFPMFRVVLACFSLGMIVCSCLVTEILQQSTGIGIGLASYGERMRSAHGCMAARDVGELYCKIYGLRDS
jgi:hypothetical protein